MSDVWPFDIDVHPAAALFPMLADEDLEDMAADIAKRGQLHPIILDADGRILDGRNRYQACIVAGVKPVFETYAGDDPEGYALAANLARRNMTEGARAVVIARSVNLTERGTAAEVTRRFGIGQKRISDAVALVKYDDLADLALAGEPIRPLLDEARERDDAVRVRESKRDRLRSDAADLLALVDDNQLSLDDAIGALDSREQQARDAADAEQRRADEAEEVARQHAVRVSDSFRAVVGRILATYHTPELRADVTAVYSDELGGAMPAKITAKTIRQAGEYLTGIADLWEVER